MSGIERAKLPEERGVSKRKLTHKSQLYFHWECQSWNFCIWCSAVELPKLVVVWCSDMQCETGLVEK